MHQRALQSTVRYAALIILALTCATFAFAVSVRADEVPPEDTQATSTSVVATSTDSTGGETGAVIVTGDSTASTSVQNELNTVTNEFVDVPGETNSSVIEASSTNTALVETADETTASTGENTATSSVGLTTIVTGVAQSTANVINVVNTNIFNSEGLILFLNQLFGGGINLNYYDLSYFFAGGAGASPTQLEGTDEPQCTLLTCLNSSELNVLNTNDAMVTNSVIVRSSTGTNSASSTDDALITTGDAYAAANVVNVVNSNIVNSSYLLLSFNNFGDLSENITLPGDDFFSRLFASGAASTSINSSVISIEGTSTVALTGSTTVSAETGQNTAAISEVASSTASSTESGSGLITTGDAYSSATEFTQANTTSVGGTSVFMLFRVSGPWTGSIVGLPEGLTALTIPDGNSSLIQILSDDATTTPEAAELLAQFNSSQLLTASNNTAALSNDIDVSADTGHNQATSSEGTAGIATGNAYAAANVVNLVNTNIVGQNWIFGVFNIMGGMSGNIVFSDGSPSLALSASASPEDLSPGGSVTYTFIVTNEGDKDATDVVLNATFDNTLLSFTDDSSATTTVTGRSWNIGTVARGSSRTFTYTANVGTNFPAGQTATVPLTAVAVNNVITSPSTSNMAEANIVVTSPPAPSTGGGGGGGGGGGAGIYSGFQATGNPSVKVVKTASAQAAAVPTTIDYKVEITNAGNAGPLFRAVLTDTLYDPDGNVMYNRAWNLDTLAPGDLIKLDYSVAFAASTTPGTYRNVARVSGWAAHPFAGNATSTQVESVISLTGGGEVLGASTTTESTISGICDLRILTHLARNKRNPSGEVMKLQNFLNRMGAKLPVTGFYGPMTQAAVSAFQRNYAGEILAPLGLTRPTGSVYGMTQRAINRIACAQ